MLDPNVPLAAAILDRAASLVWSTDAHLRVTALRGAALRQPEIDVDQMLVRTAAAHHRVLAGETVDLECEIGERVFEIHLQPLLVPGEASGCIGIARDTTALRRAVRMISWQVSHDTLAGLPNRASLRKKLHQSIADPRRADVPLALIIVDIDGMHAVNAAEGQDAGDALLAAVAERILAASADGGFAARIGGDSFAVLTNAPAPEMAAVIREAMGSTPFRVGTAELRITVSIGIAEFPQHGSSGDQLFRSAEAALRHAVMLGGNRLQLAADALTSADTERFGMAAQLRAALENGDLSLAYQPLIRLPTGDLRGLEAVLRWQRNGELIPAETFIRTAEESGVIIELGEWVIDEACRQLRAWRDEGIAPPRIAVKVASRHFQQPGFLDTVRRATERHDIERDTLEIEITETAAMSNADASARLIDRLRDLGVTVTIDEFGTCYSSLPSLKRFAIAGLKIDRSFVKDLPSSSASAIVSAVLSTAHALGLRVVADGVEEAAQAGFLSAAGCDEAQGYWFGNAVTAEAIEDLLRTPH